MSWATLNSSDVFTIEIVPELHARATRWLTDLGYMATGRLHTRLGDGYLGWPAFAPFDAIVVTCSPDHVPQPLKEQLKLGARLVIPYGPDGGFQSLHVVTRVGESTTGEWQDQFQFGPGLRIGLALTLWGWPVSG